MLAIYTAIWLTLIIIPCIKIFIKKISKKCVKIFLHEKILQSTLIIMPCIKIK